MSIEKGKLVRWIDEKGFGFIKPENGKNDIFIHISALKNMSRNPVIGDFILYEINVDSTGKQRAVNALIEGVSQSLNLVPIENQRKNDPPQHRIKNPHRNNTSKIIKSKKSFNFVPALIVAAMILLFIWYSKSPSVDNTAKIPVINELSRVPSAKFKCEGKTHCTQMGSYEEAKFYLDNCPGVEIDGDQDGDPCERQF